MVEKILEGFDPNTIEDEKLRRIVLWLMNVVEKQQTQLQEQAEEIQRLRDENNRLKGEQVKPKIRARKVPTDVSSEKERRERKMHHKESKHAQIKRDRVEVLKVEAKELPEDA